MKIRQVTDAPPVELEGLSGTISRGFADVYQRMRYDDEELLIALGNRVKQHDLEIQDSKSLSGRLMGLFSKPVNPDEIEIDGMQLYQIFELSRKKAPDDIVLGAAYRVDVDSLRTLLIEAEAVLKKRPPRA